MKWSTPYCQTSHLGQAPDKRWATVVEWDGFAELTKWFQGCGFHPHEETYTTVEQAKAAGEVWVERGA